MLCLNWSWIKKLIYLLFHISYYFRETWFIFKCVVTMLVFLNATFLTFSKLCLGIDSPESSYTSHMFVDSSGPHQTFNTYCAYRQISISTFFFCLPWCFKVDIADGLDLNNWLFPFLLSQRVCWKMLSFIFIDSTYSCKV